MGPCGSNYRRLRETNEETSNTDRALSFKLVRLSICPFFGDDQTRSSGGSISKCSSGKRRTKKTPIRSRLLGLLIVDRVSRKPRIGGARLQCGSTYSQSFRCDYALRVQRRKVAEPGPSRAIPWFSSSSSRVCQWSTGQTGHDWTLYSANDGSARATVQIIL